MESLGQCGVKLYKHCMTTDPSHLRAFQHAAKAQLAAVQQLPALTKKYATRIRTGRTR